VLAVVGALLMIPFSQTLPASAASEGSAAPNAFTGGFVVQPCVKPAGVLCGTAHVPLYWSDPSGAGLKIRFRVYPHTDRSMPALEPIVAMEGGPGYPSIGSATSYLAMIGPLHQQHDLIVMDNRGTGASGAIDCPKLQRYNGLVRPGNVIGAVQACARRLGDAANAYGTAAVGDDLAYILGRLGIHTVDVYGDSYGDYSAQVFTLHHPSLVRALVLDGSYNNDYNPFEVEDTIAMRRAWTLLCQRSASCRGRDMVREISSFARRLESHPVHGTALDSSGDVVHVDLTAYMFAQLVYDATYIYTPFRDLPAALRAFAAGDRAPLLRLAAEDVEENESGPAFWYSVGDLEMVSCHDYPTAWDPSAAVPVRKAELDAAIAKLPANVFSPFSKSVYLGSYDENELVYACLRWQTPANPDPSFPPGMKYPNTPVLIFDGQFDQATPVEDALKVAHSWPNDTFVEVSNANHVTAEGDLDQCTSVILQRFVRTLSAGDTSCAADMPPVSVVPDFPVHLADAPVPAATGGAAPSPPLARKAAWVGAQTVGDAIARWFNLTYGAGHGLYGGTFGAHGSYDSMKPLTLTLHGCRFVKDLAVSGTVVWNRTAQSLQAALRVRGPGGGTGSFTARWSTGVSNSGGPAVVSGRFDGHAVTVALPAPWVPAS